MTMNGFRRHLRAREEAVDTTITAIMEIENGGGHLPVVRKAVGDLRSNFWDSRVDHGVAEECALLEFALAAIELANAHYSEVKRLEAEQQDNDDEPETRVLDRERQAYEAAYAQEFSDLIAAE